MTTKMNKAKLAALESILEDFPPPPRMTTPKRSREKLRAAVEASLKRCTWRVVGGVWDVDKVVLWTDSKGWTLLVKARGEENGLPGSFPIDFWMDNAKPIT